METWAWLLAYVVGFGLLQLVLYHHFRRKDATTESGVHTGEGAAARNFDEAHEEVTDDPGVYCQECGARNERVSTVRYCRRCVAPLR